MEREFTHGPVIPNPAPPTRQLSAGKSRRTNSKAEAWRIQSQGWQFQIWHCQSKGNAFLFEGHAAPLDQNVILFAFWLIL